MKHKKIQIGGLNLEEQFILNLQNLLKICLKFYNDFNLFYYIMKIILDKKTLIFKYPSFYDEENLKIIFEQNIELFSIKKEQMEQIILELRKLQNVKNLKNLKDLKDFLIILQKIILLYNKLLIIFLNIKNFNFYISETIEKDKAELANKTKQIVNDNFLQINNNYKKNLENIAEITIILNQSDATVMATLRKAMKYLKSKKLEKKLENNLGNNLGNNFELRFSKIIPGFSKIINRHNNVTQKKSRACLINSLKKKSNNSKLTFCNLEWNKCLARALYIAKKHESSSVYNQEVFLCNYTYNTGLIENLTNDLTNFSQIKTNFDALIKYIELLYSLLFEYQERDHSIIGSPFKTKSYSKCEIFFNQELNLELQKLLKGGVENSCKYKLETQNFIYALFKRFKLSLNMENIASQSILQSLLIKYKETIQNRTKEKYSIQESLELAKEKLSLIEENIEKNNINHNDNLFRELEDLINSSTDKFKKIDLQNFKELDDISLEIRILDLRRPKIEPTYPKEFYEIRNKISISNLQRLSRIEKPKTISQQIEIEMQNQLDELDKLNKSIIEIKKKIQMLYAKFFKKKYQISNLAFLVLHLLKYFTENKTENETENETENLNTFLKNLLRELIPFFKESNSSKYYFLPPNKIVNNKIILELLKKLKNTTFFNLFKRKFKKYISGLQHDPSYEEQLLRIIDNYDNQDIPILQNNNNLNNKKKVYSLKYFIKFIKNKALNKKENNSISKESYKILYKYLQNLETMKASKKDILNPKSLNTFLENYEFNMHNNKNFTEQDLETYKINLLRILKKLLTDFRRELGLLKFTQINNRGKIETYGFFSNNNNNNNSNRNNSII